MNLYNFGFAASQGLPQVSEGLFTKIPFQLIIGKGENQQIYQARIVDFTTKINTILVPENFLEWANEKYANQKNTEPSRIVVETKSQSDENASTYFEQQNFDINKDELKLDKNKFLSVDLIGFDVIINDKTIGVIKDVLDTPANEVLVLDNNIMIPYVDAFIKEIDIKNKKVSVYEVKVLLS